MGAGTRCIGSRAGAQALRFLKRLQRRTKLVRRAVQPPSGCAKGLREGAITAPAAWHKKSAELNPRIATRKANAPTRCTHCDHRLGDAGGDGLMRGRQGGNSGIACPRSTGSHPLRQVGRPLDRRRLWRLRLDIRCLIASGAQPRPDGRHDRHLYARKLSSTPPRAFFPPPHAPSGLWPPAHAEPGPA